MCDSVERIYDKMLLKRTRDFITKEAQNAIVDKESALEYIDLMRPESWWKG